MSFLPCFAGVGLGIIGFAPLLLVVWLARKQRIKPTLGKGFAALGVSFAFLMVSFAAVWAFAPQAIVDFTAGFLMGFLAMWAVLAVQSMSR